MESRWSAAAGPSEREGSAREDGGGPATSRRWAVRGTAREKGVGRVDETRADRLAGTARAAVGALAGRGRDTAGATRATTMDPVANDIAAHGARARAGLCAPRRREIKRDSRSAKRRQGAKWQQISPR